MRNIVCLILSFAAVSIAWILFKEHLAIAEGKGLSLAFCDASPSSGCRIAALSPYAEIFPGFPAAALAIGFFGTSALVSLISILDKSNRQKLREIWFYFQIVSAIASLAYLIIMLALLHARCNGCLLLHLINFLIFGLRIKDFQKETFSRGNLAFTLKRVAIMGSLIILLSGFTLFFHPMPKLEDIREFSVSSEAKRVQTGFPFELDLGRGTKEVSIEMAIDLTCPYCKENILNLTEALTTLGYRAKVHFIIYPLDSDCNPYFEARIYKSCTASKIAFCELKAGRFQDFFRKTLLEQSTLVSDLGSATSMIEPDPAKQQQLKDCASSPETEAALQSQLKALSTLQLSKVVNSTPTTWVFGYQLVGRLHSSEWVQLLNGNIKQPPSTKAKHDSD